MTASCSRFAGGCCSSSASCSSFVSSSVILATSDASADLSKDSSELASDSFFRREGTLSPFAGLGNPQPHPEQLRFLVEIFRNLDLPRNTSDYAPDLIGVDELSSVDQPQTEELHRVRRERRA